MKYSKRFENAIGKLYTAFHSDTLHPECCKQCAVGNILDGRDPWRHFSDFHGSLQLNYVGQVHEMLGRRYQGYLPSELLQIEQAFLEGCGYALPYSFENFRPQHTEKKDILFDGLTAAVEQLCSLDQVPSVLDCSKLFDYKPVIDNSLITT